MTCGIIELNLLAVSRNHRDVAIVPSVPIEWMTEGFLDPLVGRKVPTPIGDPSPVV